MYIFFIPIILHDPTSCRALIFNRPGIKAVCLPESCIQGEETNRIRSHFSSPTRASRHTAGVNILFTHILNVEENTSLKTKLIRTILIGAIF